MPINFAEFHFLRPAWFLALLPLAVLIWRLWRRRDEARVWQSICDPALLPYLLVQRRTSGKPVNLGVFALSGVAAVIALAGPAWERLPAPVFRNASALVILLDMSRSMDAADISPSRIERAKFKITDILRQRRDGQTALVVYAAEPYVVTPLTTDVATIEAQLPALRTGIMPSQGSAGAGAIAKGIALLRQAGLANGELLLVTDGLGLMELERAKKLIADTGARLSILGVGTAAGAPIPDRSGGFIKDAGGNIVLEPLRPSPLRDLARAGRGVYQSVRSDDEDIRVLLRLMESELHRRSAQSTELFADRWREFGPWLLLGLIPFAPLAFRRGILTLAMAAGLAATVYPDAAVADWWVTADQAARRRFEQGDFAGAATSFEDEAWRAAAHYRAGSYEEAAAGVADDAEAGSQYNRGNALARLGRFEDAIAAYGQVLSEVPDHDDARHNKALLEALLQQERRQNEEQADAADDTGQQGQGGPGGGAPSANQANDTQAGSDARGSPERSEGESSQRESSASAGEPSNEPEQQPGPDQTAGQERIDDEGKRQAGLAAETSAEANSEMESEQATEQWLRQIPDDPGGLLRRKFEYEYRKKYGRGARRSQAW